MARVMRWRLWLARLFAGRRYVVLPVDTKASIDRMIENRSRERR